MKLTKIFCLDLCVTQLYVRIRSVLERGFLVMEFTKKKMHGLMPMALATAIFVLMLLSGCSVPIRRVRLDVPKNTALERALEQIFLVRDDIGIKGNAGQAAPLMLGTVRTLLERPVASLSLAREIGCFKNPSFAELVAFAATMLDVHQDIPRNTVQLDAVLSLPDPVRELVHSLAEARGLFYLAFEGLTREDLIFVRDHIEQFLVSGNNRQGMTRRQWQEKLERAVALASHIEFQYMAAAGQVVAAALDRFLPAVMREGKHWVPMKISTSFGDIVIGGSGDDLYTGQMPLLLVDSGGNDTYSFTEQSAMSILIDVDGNDRYGASNTAFPGAGLSGIGIIVDLAGNDRYEAQRYSQGFGFLGVGMIADLTGDDYYAVGMLGQGAAVLGIGILYDAEGNDIYQCDIYGQGVGLSAGVGLLIDRSGDDQYSAGLTVPDGREQTGAFQTYAQGFGLGMREFAAGGIGILYDSGGNDSYTGSYFCQGSAYWLSAGMLVDTGGNDHYRARRYAQGAGIHQAAGLLCDLQGDDQYRSWGVSQGCGHDFGIGLLYDARGSDRYETEWLGQGAGSSAGCGLFFDESGDDSYLREPHTLRGCGTYDERRDMISIGIFLDRGGTNSFPEAIAAPSLWRRGEAGVGAVVGNEYELTEHEPWIPQKVVPRLKVPIPDDNKTQEEILPELEAPLFLEDSWERAATLLAARGTDILPALCSYCDIKDVSVQRAIEETIKRLGREHLDGLHSFLLQGTANTKATGLILYGLGDIGNSASESVFRHFLGSSEPRLQAMALRGFSKLGIPVPKEHRKSLRKNTSTLVRRFYCLALGATSCPEDMKELCRMLEDADMQVRYGAYRMLQRHAATALPYVRKHKAQVHKGTPAESMIEDLIRCASQ